MTDKQNSVLGEIAKDAYADLAHPATHATGELVGLVPRAVKAALQPLEKWILLKEYNIAETQRLLEEKLKNVKPENIAPPEAYIAVPALQYLSYCMDNDELRNMYANLLANSMNKVVKNGVHPAFVGVIHQLCPDEAKILKAMMIESAVPTVTLRAEDSKGEGRDIIKDFSVLEETSHCENPAAFNQYFDNLIRLGLIKHAEKHQILTAEDKYRRLENHIKILRTKEIIPSIDTNHPIPKIIRSYICMTAFGKAFCKMCIGNNS